MDKAETDFDIKEEDDFFSASETEKDLHKENRKRQMSCETPDVKQEVDGTETGHSSAKKKKKKSIKIEPESNEETPKKSKKSKSAKKNKT